MTEDTWEEGVGEGEQFSYIYIYMKHESTTRKPFLNPLKIGLTMLWIKLTILQVFYISWNTRFYQKWKTNIFYTNFTQCFKRRRRLVLKRKEDDVRPERPPIKNVALNSASFNTYSKMKNSSSETFRFSFSRLAAHNIPNKKALLHIPQLLRRLRQHLVYVCAAKTNITSITLL